MTGQPVWPWEVDELPPDWLDTWHALDADVASKAAKIAKTQAKGRHGK